MKISLSTKVESIFEHFGKEKQKEKLIEEILELQIALLQLCLFWQNKKTKTYEIESGHDVKKELEESIKEEFADVVLVLMQVNKYGFQKMFDMCLRQNEKHIKILEQVGFVIDKAEIFKIVHEKAERTIDRYDIKLLGGN